MFRYRERQRTEWGTHRARVTSDSIVPFDACNVCLHTAQQPVACHQGHLFCRACVVESLAQQRERLKQRAAARGQRESARRAVEERREDEVQRGEERRFLHAEASIHSAPSSAAPSNAQPALAGYERVLTTNRGVAFVPQRGAIAAEGASGERGQSLAAVLPCYWIPQLAPSASSSTNASAEPSSPSQFSASLPTVCPCSTHALRLRQLRPVHFHLAPASPHPSCPSCLRQLSNSSPLTALTRCGHVLCSACVRELKRGGPGKGSAGSAAAGSEDARGAVECAQCGALNTEREQVRLAAGTGFAASSGTVAVATTTPAFVC